MSRIPELMGGRSLTHSIPQSLGKSSAKMYAVSNAKATAAAGTSHENTATEGSLEQLVIPAETLVAGSTIRIWAAGYVEDNNGTDTLTTYIRLGTNSSAPASNEAVFTSAAIDVADVDIYVLHGVIQIRTIGASGTAVAMWSYQDPDAAGTTPKWQAKASFAVATTSKLYLDFSADWSGAHADNETNAVMFVVDIVNPA